MNVDILNSRVGEFYSFEDDNWNWRRIADLHLPREAIQFMQITRLREDVSDTWSWSHSGNGRFSVKSAYYMIFSSDISQNINTDMQSHPIWRKIWSIKDIEPKIAVFVWRIVSGCLPLRAKLARFIQSINAGCPLCMISEETVKHLFFHCSVASQVWQKIGISTVIQQALGFQHIMDSMTFILNSSSNSEDSKLFIYCLWALWLIRNQKVFKGTNATVEEVIKHATVFSRLTCQFSRRSSCESILELYWQKPCRGMFKLNTDASFKFNKCYAGCILRNDEGDTLMVAGYVGVEGSALNAELWSIYKGLKLLHNMGGNLHITVETDCLKAVSLLYEVPSEPAWQQLFLVRACRRLLDIHPNVRVSYIRREANKVAHLIAKDCWDNDKEFEDEDCQRVCNNEIIGLIRIEALL